MSVIIGIDPGLSGCIAVLDADDFRYLDHLHMPTVKRGSKNRVNGAALAAWLRNAYDEAENRAAFLEAVAAMPGQGVSSMFSFGHSAGKVECALECLGIPYTLVQPGSWKKRAGLIGLDKDAARTRAIQLYPHVRALDAKGKGQALADAILIARFGAA